MTFQCPDCGTRIEGEAYSCPVCGRHFSGQKQSTPPDGGQSIQAASQAAGNGNQTITCRKHWSTFIVPALISFLSLLAAISGFTDNKTNEMGAAYLALGVAVLCVLYIFVSYRFNYLSLTNSHIIGHIGFIRSKKLTTPVSKVQGISLSNGLMGKIFRYHTITVTSAGTGETEYIFPRMAHAKKFMSQAQKLI